MWILVNFHPKLWGLTPTVGLITKVFCMIRFSVSMRALQMTNPYSYHHWKCIHFNLGRENFHHQMQLLFQAIIIKFNVTSDSIEKIACTVHLFLDEHVMKSQSFLIIYLIGFFFKLFKYQELWLHIICNRWELYCAIFYWRILVAGTVNLWYNYMWKEFLSRSGKICSLNGMVIWSVK